ncbi:MAG: GNAT family N-acetyltransferase [Geminicoccaceae bacterium]|nr:GNAT family N-acetyltransferase [Geminicoccaceae bacterium]MCB9943816.1 GNAT family N-acetyltransferase [Geminicoccaceae bacterium]
MAKSSIHAPPCRPATRNDAAALAAIEAAAFDPARYDGLITARQFRHFADGANAALIVVEHEGRPAGYALVLFRKGSSAGRFYSLAVDPRIQGAGLGSTLFSAAERAVLDHGATRMRLEIREDNLTLKNRYERMGYRLATRVPGYYPDGCAALRLERTVAAPAG